MRALRPAIGLPPGVSVPLIGAKLGPNLLPDGNMEAAATTLWVGSGQVTLSKETTTPHSGSRCLRETIASGSIWYVRPVFSPTIGRRYKLSGWARGDGTSNPIVTGNTGAPTYWTGTNSTSWQPFSVTFTAASATIIALMWAIGGTVGNYVEWDDVTLQAQ